MVVPAPRSAHPWPSAQSPIDTSVHFSAHMSESFFFLNVKFSDHLYRHFLVMMALGRVFPYCRLHKVANLGIASHFWNSSQLGNISRLKSLWGVETLHCWEIHIPDLKSIYNGATIFFTTCGYRLLVPPPLFFTTLRTVSHLLPFFYNKAVC